MKTLKKIGIYLALSHIFPLIGIIASFVANKSIIQGYLIGLSASAIYLFAAGLLELAMYLTDKLNEL